jgi:hypothetical protein
VVLRAHRRAVAWTGLHLEQLRRSQRWRERLASTLVAASAKRWQCGSSRGQRVVSRRLGERNWHSLWNSSESQMLQFVGFDAYLCDLLSRRLWVRVPPIAIVDHWGGTRWLPLRLQPPPPFGHRGVCGSVLGVAWLVKSSSFNRFTGSICIDRMFREKV